MIHVSAALTLILSASGDAFSTNMNTMHYRRSYDGVSSAFSNNIYSLSSTRLDMRMGMGRPLGRLRRHRKDNTRASGREYSKTSYRASSSTEPETIIDSVADSVLQVKDMVIDKKNEIVEKGPGLIRRLYHKVVAQEMR